jgi:serine/threonine protein kinase
MTDDRTQIISRTSTVEIGTELNQTYRIDSLIGVGGMGEVFKGHNIQTGDPVAIKVVLPEYARDEMIFELFRKEARVLNHLSHDAIVRYYVFSLDRTLGRPYLAMEFVDGPSLAARAKSKPLSQPDFFNLLRHLADGLHMKLGSFIAIFHQTTSFFLADLLKTQRSSTLALRARPMLVAAHYWVEVSPENIVMYLPNNWDCTAAKSHPNRIYTVWV